MAIFAGNWFDDDGIPFDSAATAVEDGSQGKRARGKGRPAPARISPDKQRVQDSMGIVSRQWKEDLTDAEHLSWTTGNNNIVNRARDNVATYGHQRFIQVAMPLHTFAQAPEATQQLRKHYAFKDWELLAPSAAHQTVFVNFLFNRQDAVDHRSVIHVSQVPARYIGNPAAWRFAHHCQSYSPATDVTTPAWESKLIEVPMVYRIWAGFLMGLYIRVTQCQNTNPPVTKTESHETTEDWTLLTDTCGP